MELCWRYATLFVLLEPLVLLVLLRYWQVLVCPCLVLNGYSCVELLVMLDEQAEQTALVVVMMVKMMAMVQLVVMVVLAVVVQGVACCVSYICYKIQHSRDKCVFYVTNVTIMFYQPFEQMSTVMRPSHCAP